MLKIHKIEDFDHNINLNHTYVVDDIKMSDMLHTSFDFIIDPFLDGDILNRPHEKMIYICKSKNLKLFSVMLGIALYRKTDLHVYTNEEFFWWSIALNPRFNHKLTCA